MKKPGPPRLVDWKSGAGPGDADVQAPRREVGGAELDGARDIGVEGKVGLRWVEGLAEEGKGLRQLEAGGGLDWGPGASGQRLLGLAAGLGSPAGGSFGPIILGSGCTRPVPDRKIFRKSENEMIPPGQPQFLSFLTFRANNGVQPRVRGQH